ncbi:hypothetical protein PsgB076_29180 [Pseudomonas savastanoi pv. glycinea str. B076]|nr:hypothetical protein PsgB076_29180 [Pseudomonas savastanoi pv. glycinea str. B076]
MVAKQRYTFMALVRSPFFPGKNLIQTIRIALIFRAALFQLAGIGLLIVRRGAGRIK